MIVTTTERIPGKAICVLTSFMMIVSAIPPNQPQIEPRISPVKSPKIITIKPIIMEILKPNIILLKTSRPSESVPRR